MKRHCNIKQSLRTKLVGFTLFAAFACVRAFADSDIDLLRKICEEQKKHAGRLENYSYTVKCDGQREFKRLHLPIRSVQHVTLLNGDGRASRSHYIAGSGPTFLMNKLYKEEVLLNNEMLLVWEDSQDRIIVFYRSDFEKSLFDKRWGDYFPYDPKRMGYETQYNETLSDLLGKYLDGPDDSHCTWEIAKEFDLEQRPKLFVLTRTTNGENRPDTIITVDPTKDYVVTESIDQEPDNNYQKITKTFQYIADQWVVSRYDLLEKSDNAPKPLEELSVTFSNIVPTPPEAAEEMSMSALKLPKSMGAYVARPGEKGVAVMGRDRMEWLNGQFVPARGADPRAPRVNPFPNAPKTKTDELIDWVIENLIYLIP